MKKRESGWVQMNQKEMVYFQEGICTGRRIPIELYEAMQAYSQACALFDILNRAESAGLN